MKHISLILIATTFLSSVAIAQDAKKGKKVETHKNAFFSKKLDFTPDQAKKFWPVYNEYLSKKGELTTEKTRVQKNLNQNSEALSEKEIIDGGDIVIGLKLKEAQLAKKYHAKFKRVIPAIKVVRLYQLEKQFNKILLDQFRNRRMDGNSGRGRRRM